jgi:predicted Zn-dependent peptidase
MGVTPVTDQELKRVRTTARRGAVGIRESALSRAVSLADSAALYNDPNRINTNTDKTMAVTAGDVQRVAKAYLRSENKIVIQTNPAPGGPAAATPKPRVP